MALRGAPALLLLLLAGRALGAEPCDPCSLPAGSYRTLAPQGWDGHSTLSVLMFLHGYTGEGADILADEDVTEPAARLGFLLVAPDGMGRSWSHQGGPSQARDDRSFLHAVLADVRRRWPVEGRPAVLGGFSEGASMVWDIACFAPLGFTAFLPFAGGFWERMPTACTAPVNLRHVHGSADTTVPLAGRPIRDRWRQADIHKGFAIWRETDHCTAPADLHKSGGGLECEVWSCRTRRTLELCLHDGGHELQAGWLEDGLRWARALPAH